MSLHKFNCSSFPDSAIGYGWRWEDRVNCVREEGKAVNVSFLFLYALIMFIYSSYIFLRRNCAPGV